MAARYGITMSKMAVNDRRQQEAYEHIKAAEKWYRFITASLVYIRT
jgi:hypothetical protein